MRIVGTAAALVLAVASQVCGPGAKAATITETIDFTASGFKSQNGSVAPKSSVSGSFTFTLDNTKSYTDVAKGLSFHSLNISVLSPLVFSYDPSQSWLTVGGNGHSNQYIWGTNDFQLSVFLDGPKPSGGFFGYSLSGHNDSYETYKIAINASSPISANARAAVFAATPLPGSVLMLLTALGVLAGVGWLRAANGAARRVGSA